MIPSVTESDVEFVALDWLAELEWSVAYGAEMVPNTFSAERINYGEIVLSERLQTSLAQLNSSLPADALNGAFAKLTQPEGTNVETRNRTFHRMLVDGVTVEYRTSDGVIRGAQVQVLDYTNPLNNDWLAVNQFTVTENKHERRPDIVLFVNGLPLGIIELKNPADENATVRSAWNQLQTYKSELTNLFTMNGVLVISDGIDARIGTLTAGFEWFKPWRTISDENEADSKLPELQVLLNGICKPERFLALIRDFTAFEDDGGGTITKKIAGYHQFQAVNVAIDETLRAAKAATHI